MKCWCLASYGIEKNCGIFSQKQNLNKNEKKLNHKLKKSTNYNTGYI